MSRPKVSNGTVATLAWPGAHNAELRIRLFCSVLDAGLRRLSQLDMPMAPDAGGTQRDIEGSGMAGENVGGVQCWASLF